MVKMWTQKTDISGMICGKINIDYQIWQQWTLTIWNFKINIGNNKIINIIDKY